VRQGVVSGNTFEDKPVTYSVIEGKAIFEGDIVIGSVEEVEKDVERLREQGALSDLRARGVVITGDRFRWPGGILPFEINHPNPQLILDAIAHWEQRTRIRFVERTANNADSFPNFVVFEQQDGCNSLVGMQGGRQVISLGTRCGLRAAIHEIGHAMGLWHEQSREDRDQFVRIRWENIDPNHRHNFDQHIADGDDVGPYDFDSIMHYNSTAFSINEQPTIEPLGEQAFGQRTGLSDGDVAAIRAMYYPITSVKEAIRASTTQTAPYSVRTAIAASNSAGSLTTWMSSL
jgi:astacin